MSPVRLNVPTKWVRLICLFVFFVVVLSTLPVHREATAQGSRPRRTQGPPSRNLPNLDTANVTLYADAYEVNLNTSRVAALV